MPRGRTYVYVPIDGLGVAGVPPGPIAVAPGTSEPPRFWFSPETPPPPGQHPSGVHAPAMPQGPGAAKLGYLQAEIDPAGAQVSVDGRRVGLADILGGARTVFALPPGTRHIELTRPGFKPLRTEIRVTPGAVFAIRARLDPT